MSEDYEKLIKYGNEELIGKGNLNVIDKIFTTDYVSHAGGKNYKGHKFIKQFIEQLRSAIPDIEVVDVELHIQADNTIAWQRTLCGTHKANMMGIPPTEQKLKWREMVISRLKGKKIFEEWVVSELAGELLSKPPFK